MTYDQHLTRSDSRVRLPGTAWVTIMTGLSAAFLVVGGARADTLTTLHSFCDVGCVMDGQTPSVLVMDQTGTLYGATSAGGKFSKGTVFELVPNGDTWKYKVIHDFCAEKRCRDGDTPSSLIVDSSGNLYGTTLFGGQESNGDPQGIVFELKPNEAHTRWNLSTLHQFKFGTACDKGCNPNFLSYAGAQTGALYDGISPLFGTTHSGGGNLNSGLVYELTPGKPWREKVIHRFCLQFDGTDCLDGDGPSGIVVDLNNTIFGVTVDGGLKRDKYAGTLYQLASTGQKKWTHTVLHYFCEETHCTDGANPVGVALDSAGNLFGTAGGGPNCEPRRPCGGIVYKLIPNGNQSQYSILYDFCAVEDCADGNYPQAPLTLDGSGNLFGSTLHGGGHDSDLNHRGGGVLFQLGSSYQVTYAFCNQEACADGEYPTQLLLDGKGNAFGITIAGGEYEHGGTVFELAP